MCSFATEMSESLVLVKHVTDETGNEYRGFSERKEDREEERKGFNEREGETRVCSIRGEVGFLFPSGRESDSLPSSSSSSK